MDSDPHHAALSGLHIGLANSLLSALDPPDSPESINLQIHQQNLMLTAFACLRCHLQETTHLLQSGHDCGRCIRCAQVFIGAVLCNKSFHQSSHNPWIMHNARGSGQQCTKQPAYRCKGTAASAWIFAECCTHGHNALDRSAEKAVK